MVSIEIDDKVWSVFKKSWALLGVKTEEELIEMLECELQEESDAVIVLGGRELLSEEPEALVLRAIGARDQKRKEQLGS